jgi:hypothetical protein
MKFKLAPPPKKNKTQINGKSNNLSGSDANKYQIMTVEPLLKSCKKNTDH